MVPTEAARRLERERDEARRCAVDINKSETRRVLTSAADNVGMILAVRKPNKYAKYNFTLHADRSLSHGPISQPEGVEGFFI